jgi:hypothetical protein
MIAFVKKLPPFALVNTNSIFDYLVTNAEHYLNQGIEHMADEYTEIYIKTLGEAKSFVFPRNHQYLAMNWSNPTKAQYPLHGYLQRYTMHLIPSLDNEQPRRHLECDDPDALWTCTTCAFKGNTTEADATCQHCDLDRTLFWTCRKVECNDHFNIIGLDSVCYFCGTGRFAKVSDEEVQYTFRVYFLESIF